MWHSTTLDAGGTSAHEDVSIPEDDGAEREIEAVVAAGDESRDVAITTATAPEPPDWAATIPHLFGRQEVGQRFKGTS